MRTIRRSRWALSFADLSLLLLGFFVLLQAQEGRVRAAAISGLHQYFSGRSIPDPGIPAETLFMPHEAMLSSTGATRISAIAERARLGGTALRVGSEGLDPGTDRFDGWDLASARIGAIARALAAAGLPARAIRIDGPAENGKAHGQILFIRAEPVAAR